MYCIQCGARMKDGDAFCDQCGAPVIAEAEVANAGGTPDAVDEIDFGDGRRPAVRLDEPADALAGEASGEVVDQGDVSADDTTLIERFEPIPSATMPGDQFVGQPAVPAQPPQAVPQVAEQPVETPASPKRKNRRAGLIAALAIVLVAAVAGGAIWWKADQDAKAAAQAAWDAAHAPQNISFSIEAPDFDEDATSIPLRLVGTDLDGNPVDSMHFLNATTSSIELLAGSYDVSFPGGYFTEAGELAWAPDAEFHVDIATPSVEEGDDGDSSSGDDSDGSSDGSDAQDESSEGTTTTTASNEVSGVVFEKVPELEITDELLQEVHDIAIQDPNDQGKADRLLETATEVRDAAVAEEQARQHAEALMNEAFGSFPRSFMFTSGVGGWSSVTDIAQDGTFTANWHDSDMGVTGPGYPNGTISVADAAGKFTVVDKVSDTDFELQLDYMQATQSAGTTIENGVKYERYDDDLYGLGNMTSTPVSGWHLYLPGQSTAGFSDSTMMWLYPVAKERESTLSMYALVNEDLGYAWFSK